MYKTLFIAVAITLISCNDFTSLRRAPRMLEGPEGSFKCTFYANEAIFNFDLL